MESQLVRPNGGHRHEQDPNAVGLHSGLVAEGGDEQQQCPEKKSVMKKVKAKARKLKETIAKHAHVHEHGQEHDQHVDVPDDRDLDEEEDDEEDKEMVMDPEAHAAPIDEPTAVVTGAGPRRNEPGQVKNPREKVVLAPATTPHSISSAPGIDRVPTQTIENFVRPSGTEKDPHSPTRSTDTANYQTKVSDPTGLVSKEADVSQLIQSIGKMAIEAELESGAERDRISTTGTGSHDQVSPETVSESIPAKDESEKQASESSYTEEIISVTAAIADTATSAKDVLASKLGSVDKNNSNGETGIKDLANTGAQGEQTSDRRPVKGITAVVTEKLSPVYEKVVETGSAVVSKVRGGGPTGRKTDESSGGDTAKGQDRGVSVKDYMAEKLKPGEEDKALSEVISDALHKRKKEMARAAEETARGKGIAGAVGGAVGYLLGKSGQTPQPQASGSGPDNGEHRREGVAETEVGLDRGQERRE